MKPAQRKAVILECAKRLFSKNGYYRTQISDIISEAKIARGTVYQYFKNKDDIFITLLEDYYKQWEQAMGEWKDEIDLATISPQDYLRYRIRKNLAFFANDRDLCNILLRVGLGLPGNLESVSRKFEARILTVALNDLRLGLHNNNVRDDLNIELTANLFSGAVLRAAYFYFGGGGDTKAPVDVDKAANEIAEVFIQGIFK
ncbi:MAG: TetR/AcrR family transcriptional regulator [Thermodesulfobacteriota bacterium]